MAKKEEKQEKPEKLKFPSIKQALSYAKHRNMRVTEHISTTAGSRINVVEPKGKPRTLRIYDKKEN